MKSIIVIQEDRPGLLTEITTLLQEHSIQLLGFSGKVIGNTAVITMEVDDARGCFRLLTDSGYRVVASETLLVKLNDEPGALARLSRKLSDAGVKVRGMHIVNKDDAAYIIALETVDVEAARNTLGDVLVTSM